MIGVNCENCQKPLTQKQIEHAARNKRIPRFCTRSCARAAEKVSLEERFWSKVEMTEDHYIWMASTSRGYGYLWTDGKNIPATHVAWFLATGAWPKPLYALHECDTPACVRKEHLFLGTQRENMDDMLEKGRVPKGVARINAKLTETDVLVARTEYRTKMGTYESLAMKYGVSSRTMYEAIRGESWRHVPMPTSVNAPVIIDHEETDEKLHND